MSIPSHQESIMVQDALVKIIRDHELNFVTFLLFLLFFIFLFFIIFM